MVKRYEIKIYFILLCVRRYFVQLPAILMLAFENNFKRSLQHSRVFLTSIQKICRNLCV